MTFLNLYFAAFFTTIVIANESSSSIASMESRLFDVSYKLQNAALQLLTNFAPSLSSDILNHGCWCSKLDPNADQMRLGGPIVYGEVDRLCKTWSQARKCLKSATEVCEFHPRDDFYR